MKKNQLWIDVNDYVDDKYPFQIFTGGRGIGKSYSAMKDYILENRKFIFMRRTQAEIDLILDETKGETANPFKPINRDFGTNVGFFSINKNICGIYDRVMENGKLIPVDVSSTLFLLSFDDCINVCHDFILLFI